MTTTEKLRWISSRRWLFSHGADEDVVEPEGGAQIDLTWQLSVRLGIFFDDTTHFRKFGDCISACFKHFLQR